MPVPRPRFTVRRLMAAVAVVTVVLGIVSGVRRRAERFRMIAAYHQSSYHFTSLINPSWNAAKEAKAIAKNNWHGNTTMKYDYAADHPWLPVAPDPPEPQ